MKRALLFLALLPSACTKSRQESVDAEPAETPAADRWVPAREAVQVGDIHVAVTQAAVESVALGGFQDRAEALVVRLSLDNLNPTRRRPYRSWAGNARLVDNFGNSYKTLRRPADTGVTEAALNPTSPVADLLLFESPIATAGYVDLHLPGENIGASSAIDFRIQLQTSGARLEAVKQAAAAHEAEARAKAAAIASREAAARRAEEAAKREAEARRLAAEKAGREAEAKQRQDELAAEKTRLEAQRLREEADRKAEIMALPGKLASARRGLEVAEDKMKKIKAARSRYAYSGVTPPEDYFDAKGRYIYFTSAQKTERTKTVQEEIDKLTVEIAGTEARLKAMGK
jgi:hypothetical protein